MLPHETHKTTDRQIEGNTGNNAALWRLIQSQKTNNNQGMAFVSIFFAVRTDGATAGFEHTERVPNGTHPTIARVSTTDNHSMSREPVSVPGCFYRSRSVLFLRSDAPVGVDKERWTAGSSLRFLPVTLATLMGFCEVLLPRQNVSPTYARSAQCDKLWGSI